MQILEYILINRMYFTKLESVQHAGFTDFKLNIYLNSDVFSILSGLMLTYSKEEKNNEIE